MANTVIVDFDTILRDPRGVRDAVIDIVTNQPSTLITVLNANEGSDEDGTHHLLTDLRFPHDNLVCNPLALDSDDIVFKTMFACKMQDQTDHKIIAVLDDDFYAMQMWEDSGVFNNEQS